jgi:hypothetical protein
MMAAGSQTLLTIAYLFAWPVALVALTVVVMRILNRRG